VLEATAIWIQLGGSCSRPLPSLSSPAYDAGVMLQRLKTWVARRFDRRRQAIGRVVRVPATDAVPTSIEPGEAFIVGEPMKWLIVGCPCRCRENLWLNLMESAEPRWTITFRGGKIGVRPSVDAVECGSHFWIADGVIRWV